ncbi:hypothetical protein ACFOKI_08050 [Sphingomonas qilianensis]|uniref:Uncharacterized protein n=1 Tax=Sphingomonas qilianensis TaxID=1736690 RepID=A0ABU9XT83_9SPHN
MDTKWRKAGLAAVIVLAPGGFILGATLGLRDWQKRRAEKAIAERDSAT